ncbi:MAG: UvrD-helicase domain-containing protein [Acidimicrobiaceae bacterium]|nr:UvrD-helicase domain-containing protein [Acidimicrobiaceae bacterium]
MINLMNWVVRSINDLIVEIAELSTAEFYSKHIVSDRVLSDTSKNYFRRACYSTPPNESAAIPAIASEFIEHTNVYRKFADPRLRPPQFAEVDLDRSRTPYLFQLRDHVLGQMRRHADEAQQRRRAEDERQRREAEHRHQAEALKREREVERQRRQARFDKELARLRQETDRLDVHRTKLSNRIHEQLRDNFLQFDQHVAKRWLSLARSTGHHEREKQRFVSHWADERYELALDEEQAAAVGTVNGNVLVTARAGSGKTRVLTARALFLHKHCGVPARRIMLLAFNRRAASEMESRLREWLGDDIPHVMTFHALAYALVHPSERLLYDDKDKGKQHLSEVTQQVIDDHIRNPDWERRIRDLMLKHFRADWNRIETGGYNLSGQEFLEHRYSLQHETLKGDRVSNFGQKAIANLLLEHSIEYRFGRRWKFNSRSMYADFVVGREGEPRLYIHFIDSDAAEHQAARQALRKSIKDGRTRPFAVLWVEGGLRVCL